MKAGEPGEDLAEDRAQREDVGPLVDPLGLAPGLLGGHVAGRAQDRAGLGKIRSSEPLRAVAISVSAGGSLPAFASATTPPRAKTLARPQSITWTSPKLPTITLDGFKSRWITPRVCA